MFVNILERKCIYFAFLGIEADRNALDSPDIIDSTDLVKISQSNMPVLLIDLYRCDGGRDLLDQCKAHFCITFICMIDKFF